ncbi:hypothetical protein niasHT_011954 [Heterodera trifolii]|uniref:Uncharacterized protein n=1 Tax=Heterodera trifolii TaxID=157864 RepID=A0ABD2KWA9_9BILA
MGRPKRFCGVCWKWSSAGPTAPKVDSVLPQKQAQSYAISVELFHSGRNHLRKKVRLFIADVGGLPMLGTDLSFLIIRGFVPSAWRVVHAENNHITKSEERVTVNQTRSRREYCNQTEVREYCNQTEVREYCNQTEVREYCYQTEVREYCDQTELGFDSIRKAPTALQLNASAAGENDRIVHTVRLSFGPIGFSTRPTLKQQVGQFPSAHFRNCLPICSGTEPLPMSVLNLVVLSTRSFGTGLLLPLSQWDNSRTYAHRIALLGAAFSRGNGAQKCSIRWNKLPAREKVFLQTIRRLITQQRYRSFSLVQFVDLLRPHLVDSIRFGAGVRVLVPKWGHPKFVGGKERRAHSLKVRHHLKIAKRTSAPTKAIERRAPGAIGRRSVGQNAIVAVANCNSKPFAALQIYAFPGARIGPRCDRKLIPLTNIDFAHLYRVKWNYDGEVWERIVRELGPSLDALSARTRAQLMGDFCYFNAVGQIVTHWVTNSGRRFLKLLTDNYEHFGTLRVLCLWCTGGERDRRITMAAQANGIVLTFLV